MKRTLFKFATTSVFTLGLSLSATAALAQPPAPNAAIQQAQRDLAANNAAAAYESLKAMEIQFAGDPQFDYWLGVAANRAGYSFDAVLALQRVIASNPGHAGAMLELAGVHIKQNRLNQAETLLATLSTMNPPPRAQEAISRYQEIIAQRRTMALQPTQLVMIGVDIGYDSNYLNYPEYFDIFADTIFQGFGVFSADSTAYTSYKANFWRRNQRPNQQFWEINAGLVGRNNQADEAKAFNTDIWQGSLGYGISTNSGATYKASIEAGVVWLDNSSYRRHMGVGLEYRQPFSERATLITDIGLRNYNFASARNNYRGSNLNLTLQYQWRPRLSLRPSLGIENESTQSEVTRQGGDLRRYSAGITAFYAIQPNQQLQLSTQYQRREYQNLGFGIFNRGVTDYRNDNVINLRAEWSWQTRSGFRYSLMGLYRDQRSNIAFFDLDQALVQGGITYVF